MNMVLEIFTLHKREKKFLSENSFDTKVNKKKQKKAMHPEIKVYVVHESN